MIDIHLSAETRYSFLEGLRGKNVAEYIFPVLRDFSNGRLIAAAAILQKNQMISENTNHEINNNLIHSYESFSSNFQ